MIELFEEYTEPLTRDEMDLVPFIEKGLRNHVGAEQAITSTAIIRSIEMKKNIKIGGPRLRKILHHIRTYDGAMLICASSKGYYVAKTQQEYDTYIKSLSDRIEAITHLRDSMKANAKRKQERIAQRQDPFEN